MIMVRVKSVRKVLKVGVVAERLVVMQSGKVAVPYSYLYYPPIEAICQPLCSKSAAVPEI